MPFGTFGRANLHSTALPEALLWLVESRGSAVVWDTVEMEPEVRDSFKDFGTAGCLNAVAGAAEVVHFNFKLPVDSRLAISLSDSPGCEYSSARLTPVRLKGAIASLRRKYSSEIQRFSPKWQVLAVPAASIDKWHGSRSSVVSLLSRRQHGPASLTLRPAGK